MRCLCGASSRQTAATDPRLHIDRALKASALLYRRLRMLARCYAISRDVLYHFFFQTDTSRSPPFWSIHQYRYQVLSTNIGKQYVRITLSSSGRLLNGKRICEDGASPTGPLLLISCRNYSSARRSLKRRGKKGGEKSDIVLFV